ncbi:MAG: hypothetical protein IPO26_01730 [Saprospiraceae bacterium]|nr:hypothetical protein [Saprospiraceae bacterium]
MRILPFIIFFYFSSYCSAQVTVSSELKQKLEGKSTFNDCKQTILQHYNEALAKLSTKDSIERKPIIRQLKKWNRQFWISEYYTDNQGIVQDRNRVNLDGLKEVERNFRGEDNGNRDQANPWYSMGPENVSAGKGIGRIDKIAFHPSDPNIIFAGSPHGGLFKSINNGANWFPISSYLSSLGISGIAIDPTNPNIIYVLTGDCNGHNGEFAGGAGQATVGQEISASKGVFKSFDGGNNWIQLPPFLGITSNTIYQGRELIINPSNPSILIAATSLGLFISDNGGESWSVSITGPNIRDVKFKPNDPEIVYAVGDNTFRKSTDGGVSFGGIISITGATRISMAVTPANPNKIALLSGSSTSNSLVGVWISSDSGDNFINIYSATAEPFDLFKNYIDQNALDGQIDFNNTIAISPFNENLIATGGLCIWASTDGGVSWDQKTAYWPSDVDYIHPDQHIVTFKSNGYLYVGNDGGIFRSIDEAENFDFISNGLSISQFYRFELTNDEGNTWGGTQDNGILQRENPNSNVFEAYATGDGYDVMTDHPGRTNNGDSDDVYFSINDKIKKDCISTICDISVPNNTQFFANLAMDSNDEDRIYAGYQNGVYISYNAGDTWTNTGGSGNWCIEVARSNGKVFAAGDGIANQRLFRLEPNGAWQNITPPAPYDSSLKITDITVHEANPDDLIITCGGITANSKVFYSGNAGANWNNITYNLPNVPVFSIDRDHVNGLYVGTSIGIFYKRPTANHWEHFSNGLPPVPVTQIYAELINNEPKVYCSTFGRGLFFTDGYRYNCEYDVNLDNAYHSGPFIGQAEHNLTSMKNNGGGEGTNVKYTAGNRIVLKDGFRANAHTKFRTYIQPCNGNTD